MKLLIVELVVIMLGFGGYFLLTKSNLLVDSPETVGEVDLAGIPVVLGERMCFIGSHQYGDTLRGGQYSDVDYVSLTLMDDGTATGVYNWVPAEKDSARGTFAGTYVLDSGDYTVSTVYSYMIEGSVQSHELLMKLGKGNVLGIGVGERESSPETEFPLRYKDRASVVYNTELTVTACDGIAEIYQVVPSF